VDQAGKMENEIPKQDCHDWAHADWHHRSPAASSPWMSDFLAPESRLVHGWSGQSQNMSMTRGADVESTLSRRAAICQSLGLDPNQLRFCEQVHGDRIAPIGAYDVEDRHDVPVAQADGLCTDEPGVALLGLSADCPLLLLFDPHRPALGLAHAGWRGTLQGIATRLVGAIAETWGSEPMAMKAVIGPCAGVCCYEVRSDVTGAWNEKFGRSDGAIIARQGKTYLDLCRAIALQLHASGLKPSNIGLPEICTICDSRFYSYRRLGASSGHSGLIAAIRE
jgi:purine-nucleoside/S-methyl-5'-thioadenosine phosphorylase / adenosine deaminase